MNNVSLFAAITLWLLSATNSVSTPVQTTKVPTPESVLGFQVGADFKLASYEDSIAYFRKLAAASDRLQLVEIGRTSFNRPWYMALVSSPENLADLERYQEISQRLAHPEGLSDEEARQLAREGKAIVNIDGGLHASEVAHAQHTIQLAYDLITGDDDPDIGAILDNVILMLWPSVNPDGQTLVVEWYRSNVGTPYETSPMPWLYQKYVGHDNNRDAYMLNMIESRVIERTWRHWEPQIRYIPHQTGPFPTRIFLPPYADPIANRVHPLMQRTINTLGMVMAQALEERGQVGATHGESYDVWYPGYVDHLPNLQNAVAFFTETALYRYATPRFYTMKDFPDQRRDLRPESFYSSPWRGGWWRLRDAVEYILTTSVAVLDFAAKYKDDVLYNRYQAGRDTIRKYTAEPPYAYFIPQRQRDPVAPVELLRRLACNGIRIHQLQGSVTVEGITYPQGTWVIPMNQEFAELARNILEVQSYPDLRVYEGGPPAQPYDASGWTLPYQFDLRVIEVTEPLSEETRAAMKPVHGEAVDWKPLFQQNADPASPDIDAAPFDSVPGLGFDTDPVAAGIVPPAGEVSGSGPALAVSPAQNNAFRAVNRAWREGGKVQLENGRYLITGLSDAVVRELVDSQHLQAERTRAGGTTISQPRIGLYRPWAPSMDEGWTRWLLEQYDFEFVNIRNADFRAGSLGERFDVIIFADRGRQTILEGFPKGTVPPRYEGGIGAAGARALDEFVRAGGTLVCLSRSSELAIQELHLPVKNVVADKKREEFFVGGSILEVTVDPAHPVMAGMPSKAKVFFNRSPVLTTTEGFGGVALAKYQQAGSPLLSGYLLGEDHIKG
ncbi:MAG: M14 family zinc carboxypeptidase, partial [Acidobacteriota bacterium]